MLFELYCIHIYFFFGGGRGEVQTVVVFVVVANWIRPQLFDLEDVALLSEDCRV